MYIWSKGQNMCSYLTAAAASFISIASKLQVSGCKAGGKMGVGGGWWTCQGSVNQGFEEPWLMLFLLISSNWDGYTEKLPWWPWRVQQVHCTKRFGHVLTFILVQGNKPAPTQHTERSSTPTDGEWETWAHQLANCPELLVKMRIVPE